MPPRPSAFADWYRRLAGRGGFRASVLTLLSGNVAAFVIGYGANVVLTRLYTPAEFGVAGYVLRVVALLTPVAALQYADALMIPKSRREAGAILWGAAGLSLLTSLLVALPLLHAERVAALLVQPEVAPALAPLLWTVPVLLLLARAVHLGELWMTLLKRFRPISVMDVLKSGSQALVRLGAGAPAVGAGAGGLVAGFFAAHALGAAAYGFLLRARPARPPLPSWGLLRQAAVRYRRFPLYAAPAALLNTATLVLPTLLFPALFPSFAVVGLYEQAFKTILVPMSILGVSVSHVFFVHAAEAWRAGTLGRLTTNVHRRVASLTLFPALCIVVAGPDLFAFVYGAPWRTAGAYAQVLAPWFYLAGIASPLTRIFDVTERQRADLASSVLMFVLVLAALGIGGATGRVGQAIGLLGAGGALGRAVQIGWVFWIAEAPARSAAAAYLRYGLYALPGLGIVALASTWGGGAWALLGVVVGGAVYAVFLLRERPRRSG